MNRITSSPISFKASFVCNDEFEGLLSKVKPTKESEEVAKEFSKIYPNTKLEIKSYDYRSDYYDKLDVTLKNLANNEEISIDVMEARVGENLFDKVLKSLMKPTYQINKFWRTENESRAVVRDILTGKNYN